MFFSGTFFLMCCCFPFERVHNLIISSQKNLSQLPQKKSHFLTFSCRFENGAFRAVSNHFESNFSLASFQGPSRRNVPPLHSSRRSSTGRNWRKLTLHHFDIYLCLLLVFFLVSSCLFFGYCTECTDCTDCICCMFSCFHSPYRRSDSDGLHVGRKVVVQTWRRWKWFCICISIWTHSCRKTWNQIMAWCMHETHERDEMMMWKR